MEDGGGVVTPEFDLSNAFENLDVSHLGSIIAEKINEIMRKIPWDKIKEGARNLATGLANNINDFVRDLDWALLGGTLAEGLNTALEFLYTFITTFDYGQLGTALGQSINGFINKVDWEKIGQTLGASIKGTFNLISKFIQEVDWAQIARDLEKVVANIDWAGVATSLFEALGSALGGIASFIGQLLTDAWNGITGYFDWWIEQAQLEGYDVATGILMGIGNALINIGQWIYDNVFLPFINGFKEAFGIHSPSTVMQTMGGYIVDGLKDGISGMWKGIKDTLTTVVDNIKTKFTTAKDKIVSVFKSLKTKLKEIFKSIWTTIKKPLNSILGGIEKLANGVIKGINTLVKALNKVNFKIPDWIPELGGKSFGFDLKEMQEIKIPRLASGGIINMPNKGVMLGNAIGGESGREGVIPLTDSHAMELLGEAIGRYITINANITNTMNGRVINRQLLQLQNEENFAYNT